MNRGEFRKYPNLLVTRYNERDLVPPITGNPFTLRREGQSGRQAFLMWTGYLIAYGVSRFLLFAGVGLLIYPLALTFLWLKFLLY